ncbi:MAG TPA: SH3 domain-containing protein, partial [Thermomicrobiales bacterium]|nr:SH3 domain-containing protein [Thermomicrobiales bacterium]
RVLYSGVHAQRPLTARNRHSGFFLTMSEPDLENRLRQHSRRAGLMIGLSMVLTIAICIGSATLIYAALVPVLSDVVPIEAPAPRQNNVAVDNPPPDGVSAAASEPTPTPAPAAPIVETAPTAALAPATPTNAFTPDYQINAAESVNFRAGPSTSDQILQALPPATPLQYLNKDAPAANPNDGPRWMKFKIEDGTVGWIRQIDTEAYRP